MAKDDPHVKEWYKLFPDAGASKFAPALQLRKPPADISPYLDRVPHTYLDRGVDLEGVLFVFYRDALREGGALCTGRTQIVPASARRLLAWFEVEEPPTFMVTLSWFQWLAADEKQRVAILHHELCHLEVDQEYGPMLRPHDAAEFTEIVRAYGVWRPGLRDFCSMVQLKMDMDEDGIELITIGEEIDEDTGEIREAAAAASG